jgi:hypothetical protein
MLTELLSRRRKCTCQINDNIFFKMIICTRIWLICRNSLFLNMLTVTLVHFQILQSNETSLTGNVNSIFKHDIFCDITSMLASYNFLLN